LAARSPARRAGLPSAIRYELCGASSSILAAPEVRIAIMLKLCKSL
jgi:hypothetical protein